MQAEWELARVGACTRTARQRHCEQQLCKSTAMNLASSASPALPSLLCCKVGTYPSATAALCWWAGAGKPGSEPPAPRQPGGRMWPRTVLLQRPAPGLPRNRGGWRSSAIKGRQSVHLGHQQESRKVRKCGNKQARRAIMLHTAQGSPRAAIVSSRSTASTSGTLAALFTQLESPPAGALPLV